MAASVIGVGYLYFEFKIASVDGKYSSHFTGSVKIANFGLGLDAWAVISTGTLEGPYILT